MVRCWSEKQVAFRRETVLRKLMLTPQRRMTPSSPLPLSSPHRGSHISSNYISAARSSNASGDAYSKYSSLVVRTSIHLLLDSLHHLPVLETVATVEIQVHHLGEKRYTVKMKSKRKNTDWLNNAISRTTALILQNEQHSPSAARRKRRNNFRGGTSVEKPQPLQLTPPSSIPQAMPAADSYNKVRSWTQHMATVPPEELLPAVEDDLVNEPRVGNSNSANVRSAYRRQNADGSGSPRIFNFNFDNEEEDAFFKKRASTRTSEKVIQDKPLPTMSPKERLRDAAISRRNKILAEQQGAASSPKPARTQRSASVANGKQQEPPESRPTEIKTIFPLRS